MLQPFGEESFIQINPIFTLIGSSLFSSVHTSSTIMQSLSLTKIYKLSTSTKLVMTTWLKILMYSSAHLECIPVLKDSQELAVISPLAKVPWRFTISIISLSLISNVLAMDNASQQVVNVNKIGQAKCAKFIKKRIAKELWFKIISLQIANATNQLQVEISVKLCFVTMIVLEKELVKLMDHAHVMTDIQGRTVVFCRSLFN